MTSMKKVLKQGLTLGLGVGTVVLAADCVFVYRYLQDYYREEEEEEEAKEESNEAKSVGEKSVERNGNTDEVPSDQDILADKERKPFLVNGLRINSARVKQWAESFDRNELPFLINRATYEQCLQDLDDELGDTDPRLGISTSLDSPVLKVSRESSAFGMGGRAALLQLAHPFVAKGIELHSNLSFGVQQRFFRTFQYMFPMTFGTRQEMYRASRTVRNLHDKVTGKIGENIGAFTENSPFEASQVFALLWVFATLLESQVIAYELTVKKLTMEEKDELASAGGGLLMLFGVPKAYHFRDWEEFMEFCKVMWRSDTLTVSKSAKAITDFIFLAPRPGSGPFMDVVKWASIVLLPPKFREPLLGRKVTQTDHVLAAMFLGYHRFIYRFVPESFRFLTPYWKKLEQNGVERPAIDKFISNVAASFATGFIRFALPPRDPELMKKVDAL